MDTPEAREREHARQRCPEDTWNEHGGDTASDARHQEDPPDAGTTIILRLDDDGMEETYAEEGRHSDYYASNVHWLKFLSLIIFHISCCKDTYLPQSAQYLQAIIAQMVSFAPKSKVRGSAGP